MRHKIAVVGCGNMEGTHSTGFGELADRLEVVAAVDPVLERAAKAAEVLGARRAVTDYREIVHDADVALVVTPHHVHHEIGLAFLRAGKHVLMEKPLAITEAECLDLIHAAQEADRVLMTAYPMRYHPLVVALKGALDAGTVGEVFQISIWTEQHTEREPGHWMNGAATLGGGQFFSHGCHYVDLLLWMLGEPIRGTHVGTRKGTPWMEMEGTSNVAIEFAGGALGYHFGTWGARGTRLGYSIHAHGTTGMAELDFHAGELRVLRGKEAELIAKADKGNKYVQHELAHFLDCVETGRVPDTNGPGSLQGLRVIWRLYEAERQGVMADLRGLGLNDPWEQTGLDRLPT